MKYYYLFIIVIRVLVVRVVLLKLLIIGNYFHDYNYKNGIVQHEKEKEVKIKYNKNGDQNLVSTE